MYTYILNLPTKYFSGHVILFYVCVFFSLQFFVLFFFQIFCAHEIGKQMHISMLCKHMDLMLPLFSFVCALQQKGAVQCIRMLFKHTDLNFSSFVGAHFIFIWCTATERCSSAHLDAFQTHNGMKQRQQQADSFPTEM